MHVCLTTASVREQTPRPARTDSRSTPADSTLTPIWAAIVQPLPAMIPTADAATSPHNMALRTLMQAKVTCANTIHELDTIDCFTDDWPLTTTTLGLALADAALADAALADAALEIHLACQHAAAECGAIVEMLDALLSDDPAMSAQPRVLVEMEVRRENAGGEIEEARRIVEELAEGDRVGPELSLREIGMRAWRLGAKLRGMRGVLEELEVKVQAPALQPQSDSPLQAAV
ncbi:hypothetical protein LTR53_000345 [Teratosphaeriaceae sp. CCFEE 6253]|nr:hypothetical protein LTR53_000345 [Teratosphaeriaceae sp. CCFEE 6253]